MTCWVHLGRIRDVFFFDRSGSDRTRAHLASRLLLCPNTHKPHMYCMKYCYNNYTINIIHRLCNTYALAYRWQLTMQSISEKLARGELLKIPNASGKFCLYWYLWTWLSVVVVMFETYYKSLPLSSVWRVCVCVFVYSRDSARQRA